MGQVIDSNGNTPGSFAKKIDILWEIDNICLQWNSV